MFEYYKNIATKAIEEKNITEEEAEAIYRFIEFQYRCEDIENHADYLQEIGDISEEERNWVYDSAQILAERYIYTYQDCNHAENDAIDSMILDYIKDGRQTPYSVFLSSCGNIDHGENPFVSKVESVSYHCKSIEECQAAVMSYIDENDLGAGNWNGGQVYKHGTQIGSISYNGRFWALEK